MNLKKPYFSVRLFHLWPHLFSLCYIDGTKNENNPSHCASCPNHIGQMDGQLSPLRRELLQQWDLSLYLPIAADALRMDSLFFRGPDLYRLYRDGHQVLLPPVENHQKEAAPFSQRHCGGIFHCLFCLPYPLGAQLLPPAHHMAVGHSTRIYPR